MTTHAHPPPTASAPTHPSTSSSTSGAPSHHRKIDLQSPADLTYLLQNIQQAAREKIDLAIPISANSDEGSGDRYRERVEELVTEYINQTLTLALPSISINGLDCPPTTTLIPSSSSATSTSTSDPFTTSVSDPSLQSPSANPSAYEPYDPRLAERLRGLYAQFEDESTKVAELRREAPVMAARAWREGLEGAVRGDEEAEARRVGAVEEMERERERNGEKVLGDLALPRQEEVGRSWGRGVQGLRELGAGGVTGVVARLERAERAVGVVEGRE